jgi:hypothetical protein
MLSGWNPAPLYLRNPGHRLCYDLLLAVGRFTSNVIQCLRQPHFCFRSRPPRFHNPAVSRASGCLLVTRAALAACFPHPALTLPCGCWNFATNLLTNSFITASTDRSPTPAPILPGSASPLNLFLSIMFPTVYSWLGFATGPIRSDWSIKTPCCCPLLSGRGQNSRENVRQYKAYDWRVFSVIFFPSPTLLRIIIPIFFIVLAIQKGDPPLVPEPPRI